MPEIDLLRRLKYLEEKISMFNNIIQTIDVTTRKSLEDIRTELEEIRKEIKEIRDEIDDLEIKVKAITDQLSLFATVDQVKTISSIIDYINPFDFVTKKEVEKIVKEKILEYLNNVYNVDNQRAE
jgi:DNA repair exonuclease SbcCD ATPase subunit